MKTSMLRWRCHSNRLVRSTPLAHEYMHTSLQLYSSMHRVDLFCKNRLPVKRGMEAMQSQHLCFNWTRMQDSLYGNQHRTALEAVRAKRKGGPAEGQRQA